VIRPAGGDWIKPRRLAAGDRVALIAPASAFPREEFDAGCEELRRLGFEPVFDERVFERSRFAAGDARLRAAALSDAWTDPSVRALIAVRGGYGSAELLPLIDPRAMIAGAKIFIGYSDTTALLSHHLRHHLVCFHGPMIDRRLSRGEAGYDRDSFLRAVTGTAPVGALTPTGLVALREGSAEGRLAGGTLTQLVSSLGTPWAFEPEPGAILFIEDIAERPYRVHRMLTQLAQAGRIERATAIVFGEFPSCDEPGGGHLIRDVLAEFMQQFAGPVLFGFPSGHTTGPTWTLPLGVRARVVTEPRPAVIIEEAAVV
jgi:muramoyltetrapeptide carboxypeptidase